MVARGTLLRNKPYTFVPLLPVRPEDRREIVPHNCLDRSRWTGRLVLELEVITPLHIGSGSLRFIGGQLVREFLRSGETPVIPGASLKGVVRAVAEAVTRSCVWQSPGRGASKHRLDKAFPFGVRTQCTDKAACAACRLFGFSANGRGYRGRVAFGEMKSAGRIELAARKLPALEQPFKDYPRGESNSGGGNERLYYCQFYSKVPCKGPLHCSDCTKEEWLAWKSRIAGTVPASFRGRKFYLPGVPRTGNQPCEMAMPGSRYTGEMTFQNLDTNELSLLSFALGLDGTVRLSLGYGKPAYYGTVRLRLQDVRWYGGHSSFVQSEYPDLVNLAKSYGDDDPDVKKNVALVREILSGERCGPDWGDKGY